MVSLYDCIREWRRILEVSREGGNDLIELTLRPRRLSWQTFASAGALPRQ